MIDLWGLDSSPRPRWIGRIGERPAVLRGIHVPPRAEVEAEEDVRRQVESARSILQR